MLIIKQNGWKGSKEKFGRQSPFHNYELYFNLYPKSFHED